jgi:hypothetical protein
VRYKNKRVCGTVPKTGALRKPDLLGEEVVVPDVRVSAKLRASLRAIRQGKTVSMEEARAIIASSVGKRAPSKKRTRA